MIRVSSTPHSIIKVVSNLLQLPKIIKHENLINFLEKNGYFILAKAKTSDEVTEKAAEKVLDVAEEIVEESVDGSLGE